MRVDELTKIAFTDPSGGKANAQRLKRTSARSSIVVIGVDDLCRIFVLFAWADRCPTDTYVEKIYKTYDDFKPKIFGVEANAMQTLFGDMLSREARVLKKRIPFVPVFQNTKVEKKWRIRTTLQPVIAEGRLLLMDNQLELQAELSTHPMSPTVDIIDALASAVALAPVRAAKVVRDERKEALAKYLRDSGATPRQIADRLRALNIQ